VSACVELRRRLTEQPPDGPVGKDAAAFDLPRLSGEQRGAQVAGDRHAVVRVDALFPSGLKGLFD